MTGDLSVLSLVLDKVESILTHVSSPIILWMFWFSLLALFLRFKN